MAAPQTAAVPQFGHEVLLVEENHGYSQIIGSPDMPCLNSLAAKYGLATQYFANTHPSIGNYFMLTTGQLVTNDSGFAGPVDVDNLVRELGASGKSWKSYAESLPSVGYTGGDVYPYVKHHNPFAYFTDVLNSNAQMQSLVSTSQFSTDLANNQLPNISFVCPNLLDDAHDGSTQAADAWLQQHIAPLIASPTFQNDGLLIILFDEARGDDSNKGGGHVAAVIVSAKAKPGFQSTNVYQHQSTLRLILQALRVTTLPGEASTAPEMAEFFQ
jgi:acid phosphatase